MSTPFYDLASLVVVPSGYKSGKIYAQKPMTTDGQLTFSRASTATRVNASGLIETVASNVPRLDYQGATCGPRLLLEPQRTNAFLHSSAFDNVAWTTNSAVVTANDTTSPSGAQDADKITITGISQILSQNPTLTSGQPFVLSVFVKAGNWGIVRIGNVSSATSGAWFNVTNGTAGTINGGTSEIIDYGNGWYRLIAKFSSFSSGISFIGISDADGSTTTAPVGSFMYLWGAQIEGGFTYPTSLINTTTAAVTRLADACSKTGIASLIGQTEGTLFVDITTTDDITTVVPIGISDGSAGNRVIVFPGSGVLTARVTTDNVTVALFTSSSISANTRYKMAIAYKENDFAFYVNGVQIGTDTNGSVPACSRFGYDNGPGSTGFYGLNSQALLFKTRLTNAQLAELTAL